MAKKHAYRNIKMCTKDCLCLFVCPTGAANNETGQIDYSKCIGCGVCAEACPSKAITLIPNNMPEIQPKNKSIIDKNFKLANFKIEEIKILKYLLKKATNEEQKILKALIYSNQIIIEDLMRESGYMLPNTKYSKNLLNNIRKNEELKEIAQELIEEFE